MIDRRIINLIERPVRRRKPYPARRGVRRADRIFLARGPSRFKTRRSERSAIVIEPAVVIVQNTHGLYSTTGELLAETAAALPLRASKEIEVIRLTYFPIPRVDSWIQLMKKSLQFVALILTALLSGQPLLAAAQCTPSCAGTPSAQCCNQPGGMSTPGMAAMRAPSRPAIMQMACSNSPCCVTLQAAIIPVTTRLGPPHSTPLILQSDPVPPTSVIYIAASPIIAPPGLRTARYILFQNFRI